MTNDDIDVVCDIPEEPSAPKLIRRNITITEEVDQVLKFAGDGNRSRGIRELARLFVRLAASQVAL